MIFVRDDIPTKEIKIKFLPSNIVCLFIELNIRKTKWLIVGCYHPPSQNDNYFFYNLSKALDSLNSNYEKFLLVGDFNSEDHETEITNFLNNYKAKNIVKQKAFPIPCVLICLLLMALKVFSIHIVFLVVFLITIILLLYTVLKNTFGKQKSNIKYYRDWKKIDNAIFRTELREELDKVETHNYQSFEQIFLSLLNLHAPMKSKKQHANHKSYMTKALRKAIMKRSEQATKYH